MRAAMDSGDPTAIGNAVLAGRALRDQQRAIHEEFMAEFRTILTLAQEESLDSIEAFNRGRSGRDGGRGGGGRGGGRGNPTRPRAGR